MSLNFYEANISNTNWISDITMVSFFSQWNSFEGKNR